MTKQNWWWFFLILSLAPLSACGDSDSTESPEKKESTEEKKDDSTEEKKEEGKEDQTAPTNGAGAEKTQSTDPSGEKTEEKKKKVVKVRVTPVSRGEISSVVETTSLVEAEEIVDVYPKAQGIVLQLFVEEGNQVDAGQALAKLDDREAKNQASQNEIAYKEAQHSENQAKLSLLEAEHRRDQARKNAEQAQRDYERNQSLWEQKGEGKDSLISKKDLEASKLAWDKAEGEFQTAQLAMEREKLSLESLHIAMEKALLAWELSRIKFDDTTLRAPIAGVISYRGIKTGETMTLGTRAFTIVNLDQLITNFFRPQKELKFLAKGMKADATTDAYPEVTFAGFVLRINPVVDPASGTFKVTAQIENREHFLRPGMLLRIKIIQAVHTDTVLIPKKAIIYDGDQPTIFAVREGVAIRIPLEAGFSDRERIEVLNVSQEGLRPDDRIIVTYNAELYDGQEVEVVDG